MAEPGSFERVIDDALAHKADNSDAALIARACKLRLRMGGPFDRRRAVNIEYDSRTWLARAISDSTFRGGEAVINYFATVDTWYEDGVIRGRILQKPHDLANKPDDPFVRFLIEETGATP